MKNFLFRVFSSLLLAPLVFLLIYLEGYYFYTLLFIMCVFGIYEILLLKSVYIQFVIIAIFLIFIYSIVGISNLENGKFIILYIVLLTWLSDIGGYSFGKIVGGKKIKIISPNKTYSGFIGSLCFTETFIFFFSKLNLHLLDSIYYNFYFIFACTMFVIFGDLIFSYLKRMCDIKDFSNILPGHGGLYDRIDGLMFITIFIYLFLK